MLESESKVEIIDIKALTSALDHARIMANHSAEIRMRNFNYFILVTGALVAGFARLPSPKWDLMMELAGIITSFLFFALDVRGYDLLMYNQKKVDRIEPLLWSYAGLTDWTKYPRHEGLRKMLSIRVLYRAFFVVVGLSWVGALILSIGKF